MDSSKQTPQSTPVVGSRFRAITKDFEGPDNRHTSKKLPRKSFTNPRTIPEGTPIHSIFQNLISQRASPFASSNGITSNTPKTTEPSFQYSDKVIHEAVNIFKSSVGGPIDPFFIEKMAKSPSEITELLTDLKSTEPNPISHPLGHKRYATNFPQKPITLCNHYGHNILYHSSWQTTFNPKNGNPVDHNGRTVYFEDNEKKLHKQPPELSPYHPVQRANFRNDRVNPNINLADDSNGVQTQNNALSSQPPHISSSNAVPEPIVQNDSIHSNNKVEHLVLTANADQKASNIKKPSPETSTQSQSVDHKSELKPTKKIEAEINTPVPPPPSSDPVPPPGLKKDKSETKSTIDAPPPYSNLINRELLNGSKIGSEALNKSFLEIQKLRLSNGKLDDAIGIFALQTCLNSLSSKPSSLKSLDLISASGEKMSSKARESFIQNVSSQGNDIIFDKSSGKGKWKVPITSRKSPMPIPTPSKGQEKVSKSTNNEPSSPVKSRQRPSSGLTDNENRPDQNGKSLQLEKNVPKQPSSLQSKSTKPNVPTKMPSSNTSSTIKQEIKTEVKLEKPIDNISLLAQNTILKPIPAVKASIGKNGSSISEPTPKTEEMPKSISMKKGTISVSKPINPVSSKIKSIPMSQSDTGASSLSLKKPSKSSFKQSSQAPQTVSAKKILVTITIPSQKHIEFQTRCFAKYQRHQKPNPVISKSSIPKDKRILIQPVHDDYLSTSPEYKESAMKSSQKRAREDLQLSLNSSDDTHKQVVNRGISKNAIKSQRRGSKPHLSPVTGSHPVKESTNIHPTSRKIARISPTPQLPSTAISKNDSTKSKSGQEMNESLPASRSKLASQAHSNTTYPSLPPDAIPTTTPRDDTPSLRAKMSRLAEIAKEWKSKCPMVVNDPNTTDFQKKQALVRYLECCLMFIHNADINDFTQEHEPMGLWVSITHMLEQAAKYLKFHNMGVLYGLGCCVTAMSYVPHIFYTSKKFKLSQPLATNDEISTTIANTYKKVANHNLLARPVLNLTILDEQFPLTIAKCKAGELEYPHDPYTFKWVSMIKFAQSLIDEYISKHQMQTIKREY